MSVSTVGVGRKGPRKATLHLAAVVLVIALAAVIIGAGFVPKRRFHGTLTDLVPSAQDVPAWTRKSRDVAESIEVARYIKEYLGYDDAIYVDFSRGDLRISVYASYWKPGKIASEWVASHTPDLCWVEAGWKSLSRETRDIRFPGGNGGKITLEDRAFRIGNQTEYVVFCHIVGGKLATYTGVGPRPSRVSGFLTRLWDFQWSRPDAEQLFLRVSSNRPPEQFITAAPFEILLQRLNHEFLRIFDP